jgi:hypothetical protein
MTNLRVFLGAHDATEAGACAKTVRGRTNEMPAASLSAVRRPANIPMNSLSDKDLSRRLAMPFGAWHA